jgi:predicted DNA-binding WGR domain protein
VPEMLEMRTVMKKIKPEENCFRYYEMTVLQTREGYGVQLKWGRLYGGLIPRRVQVKELQCKDADTALACVLKKIKQKQERGYYVD